MSPLIVLAIIAGVALLGGVMYLSYLHEKQRREALEVVAQDLGWRFSPDRDGDYSRRYGHFHFFCQGHTRFAHNLMTGELSVDLAEEKPVDLPAQAGDYHYQVTTHNGKQSQTTTYRFSFVLLHLPPGLSQDLVIRKENFGDRLKAGLGFDDIDFESVEFSDHFYVQSRDKRFAYDVIHPRMMELLLDSKPQAIWIDHDCLCLSNGSGRWKPEQFGERIEWLKRFFAHWPRHLNVS